MKPYRKFRPFQIRWKEALGLEECPYLYRWTFLFFNYSIRIHHWLKSDDMRFFHDHSCDFVSVPLKGRYWNVTPHGVGVAKPWRPWFFRAKQRHYLMIPKGGVWTLLICGRPYHKWGFYVKGKKVRPLQYFHKYGVVQTADYQ